MSNYLCFKTTFHLSSVCTSLFSTKSCQTRGNLKLKFICSSEGFYVFQFYRGRSPVSEITKGKTDCPLLSLLEFTDAVDLISYKHSCKYNPTLHNIMVSLQSPGVQRLTSQHHETSRQEIVSVHHKKKQGNVHIDTCHPNDSKPLDQ